MRITTAYTFNASVETLQRRQQDLAEAQLRLTSGKRVQRASDDPTAAARAERALAAVSRTEAEQRAIDASRNVMTLAESALGDAGELLQQARELLVAAGNASYSARERGALATQLEGIRTQLLAIANRSDGAGTYLFAGRGGDAPPFEATPDGDVVYRGLPGDFSAAGREPLPLSIDGMAAWRADAASGKSAVFAGIDEAIAALRENPPATSGADVAAAGLASVDGSLDTLQALRARIGELLHRADLAEGRVADERLYHQSERSRAEDLDMVQAIADFQNQQTGYEAALKTYATVQRLSLFQYLNG